VTQEEKDVLLAVGALAVGGGLLIWFLKSVGVIQNAGTQVAQANLAPQTPQEYADANDQVPPFVPGT
jgi:hypothetical protein